MSAFLRRIVATFAIAVFAGTLALPLGTEAHQSWNDDPDCAPSVGAGHRPAAVQAVNETAQTGHCALCHWLRAFAGASLTPVQSSIAVPDASGAMASNLAGGHGRLASLDRPSRAPPASL